MTEKPDKITCHVLDTRSGLPARGIRVKLEGGLHPLKMFESLTDDDGRIEAWLPYSGAHSSGEVPIYTLDDVLGDVEDGKPSRWTLHFDTATYFGGDESTFFPEVTVTFTMRDKGQKYHVPLLLSPYGYTTYRGS
jgi:5-hydroxyisourate hydrolase